MKYTLRFTVSIFSNADEIYAHFSLLALPLSFKSSQLGGVTLKRLRGDGRDRPTSYVWILLLAESVRGNREGGKDLRFNLQKRRKPTDASE